MVWSYRGESIDRAPQTLDKDVITPGTTTVHRQLHPVVNHRLNEVLRGELWIECGSSIPSTRLLRVMDEPIEFYGKAQAIRMDNGQEMTSAKFIGWAEQQGIELRYIQPGKPNQNAFIERFNRSVWQKVLNAWLFDSLEQAQQILEDWRVDYNVVRSHESLGNRPPLVYLPRVGNAEISTSNLST